MNSSYAFAKADLAELNIDMACGVADQGQFGLEIQGHLRAAHGIAPGTLGIEDLLALHDNDHNRRGYQAGHGHKKATKGQSKGYAGF